ncbi:MAG: hypothetical protein ACYC5N_00250 [Endomicrobiales bacterium]
MDMLLFSWPLWGALFILAGLLIVLKIAFDVNVPVFKGIFALLLIYFGIWVLVCGIGTGDKRDTLAFNEGTIETGDFLNTFRIVLGRGTIDLTEAVPGEKSAGKEVKILLGEGTLLVDPETPMRMTVKALLSAAVMPGGDTVASGEYTYSTESYKEGAGSPAVNVHVVVTLGKLEVKEVAVPRKRGGQRAP